MARRKTQDPKINLDDAVYINAIGEDLFGQRQHYRTTVKQNIYQNGWLDKEHVDGAIRAAVTEDRALAGKVKVFPIYCARDLQNKAADEVAKELMKNVPIDPPLPEASTLKGRALTQLKREQTKRNKKNLALKAQAKRNLEATGVDETKLFNLFLTACRQKKELWQDQASAQRISRGDQWVIPMRINGNHFTTLVIHFGANDTFYVKYFNSMAKKTEKDVPYEVREVIEGLKAHLNACDNAGYVNGNFLDISQNVQKENYNCGVFAFYSSLYLIYKNLKKVHPSGNYKDWMNSRYFTREYDAIMLSAREEMATLLRNHGYETKFINAPEPGSAQKKSVSNPNEEEAFLSWTAVGVLILGALGIALLITGIPPQIFALTTGLAAYLPASSLLTIVGSIFAGAFVFSITRELAGALLSHYYSADIQPSEVPEEAAEEALEEAPEEEPEEAPEEEAELAKKPPRLLPGFNAARKREKDKKAETKAPRRSTRLARHG